MIHVDEVVARIEARVPALAGRFQTVADFAALVDRNQLPQLTPAAFAMLGALVGGAADAATGIFRQQIGETVVIVLVDRHVGDATGGQAGDALTPMVRQVIEAVCGWGPETSPGVFALGGAELVGFKPGGAVLFHIEFSLQDQLRIVPA